MVDVIKIDKIKQKDIIKRIKFGDIFIYPTDTGYYLGCNALKSGSISIIKQIIKTPLSIIAPNKQWITKNFEIINKNHIKKLPGPYTYILKSKKRPVARNVNPGENKFRIKIPEHNIHKIIKSANIPIIKANINQKRPTTSIKQIPWKVSRITDLILDEGKLIKRPSSIIDLTTEIPLIIRG
jgi:tRNA threonylcarbamoyl adenosine modification protein (Sua5/YciO/YrdC/YwlC family)